MPGRIDFHSDIGMKYQSGPWSINSEVDGTVSRFHQRQEIIDTSLDNEVVTFNSDDNGHGEWTLHGPSPDVPANFYLQNLFEAWQQNSGSELAWKNSLRYNFSSGFLTAVEGGLRLADRRTEASGNPGISTCVPGATAGSCNDGNVSATATFGPNSFQQFNGGDGNAPYFVGLGTDYLLDNVLTTRAYYDVPLSGPPADPTSGFSDDEFTTAFWGQALFAFNMGSIPVDGQFGLRTVIDDRTLSGADADHHPGAHQYDHRAGSGEWSDDPARRCDCRRLHRVQPILHKDAGG